MYLLAAFILQIFFKKILEFIQGYEDKHHFQDQNGSFVLNKKFLAQTVVITFIYLLALFISFLQQTHNYEDAPFLGPKCSICPKFLWTIITIILMYLWTPFIVLNLKKILPADPELWGCAVFGPNMAHFPKWEFFQKTF